jgi:hypothetical protein
MANKEEDDEIVLSGDEEEDEDIMIDGNPFEDLLVSDEGDNIANVLAKGMERVCQQLDVQNKIFVKLYTVLSKLAPPSKA